MHHCRHQIRTTTKAFQPRMKCTWRTPCCRPSTHLQQARCQSVLCWCATARSFPQRTTVWSLRTTRPPTLRCSACAALAQMPMLGGSMPRRSTSLSSRAPCATQRCTHSASTDSYTAHQIRAWARSRAICAPSPLYHIRTTRSVLDLLPAQALTASLARSLSHARSTCVLVAGAGARHGWCAC